ncbi:MAG: FAD-dependent oxidoreductase [Flexilinea sp.]
MLKLSETGKKKGKEFGFSCSDVTIDYHAAYERSRKVSKKLSQGVSFLLKKNKVDHKSGTGKLIDSTTVLVEKEGSAVERLSAKNIVIASGARSTVISGIEVDHNVVINYRDALLQDKLPGSVIIIGGGVIGIEFSTVWRAYGAEVTIRSKCFLKSCLLSMKSWLLRHGRICRNRV